MPLSYAFAHVRTQPRPGEFEKHRTSSQAAGGLHHRFGIGDGYVMVVDEWESIEQFQQFFADPELQAWIGTVGAAAAPPEIIVAQAISSPDEF